MMDLHKLPNARPNEKLELFLRRHWVAVFKIVIVFVALFVVPVILAFVMWEELSNLLTHTSLGPVTAIVISIYFLGMWLLAFVEYTDYYLDTWIVTNERIINIEQHGLFRRVASELHLNSIQDVTSETHGIIQTFLNYGDVEIQTAGQTTRFNFKTIGNPEKVKQKILYLVEADRRRHRAEGRHEEAIIQTPAEEVKELEV